MDTGKPVGIADDNRCDQLIARIPDCRRIKFDQQVALFDAVACFAAGFVVCTLELNRIDPHMDQQLDAVFGRQADRMSDRKSVV